MKCPGILTILCCFSVVMADMLDLSEFKDVGSGKEVAKIVIDFEKPLTAELRPGYSLDPVGGENGTAALHYEKTDASKYILQTFPINPDRRYRYRATVNVRCEGVENIPRGSRFFCVEFYNKGKYVDGSYNYNTQVPADWKQVSLEFQPPAAEYDRAIAVFFLCKKATGKVWWDNLQIEPLGMKPANITAIRPANLSFRDNVREIRFRCELFDKKLSAEDLALQISINGQMILLKREHLDFYGELADLPAGKVHVKAFLLHPNHKTILAARSFELFSAPGKRAGKSCWIDDYGRTIVDGKLFMPIGMMSYHLVEDELKMLREAGFNCIMPYRLFRQKSLPEAMDSASKYQMKVLFPVHYQHERFKGASVHEFESAKGLDDVIRAWVRKVKDHPALMGYYTSDENPEEELPRLRLMREMINEIDPDHFTVGLTFMPTHFVPFANTCDVLAVDTYPIAERDTSMENIPRLLNVARHTGAGLWFVPQGFNFGVFKGMDDMTVFKKYRFPEESEIRSMVLSGMINGAKGFMFFLLNALDWEEKVVPGSKEAHWPRVASAARLLNELAPFILSLEPQPPVVVEGKQVEAAAWTHEGKTIVAVAGIGPGANEAVITIPGCTDLKSRFGCTENLGQGKYRFKADNISSDILY